MKRQLRLVTLFALLTCLSLCPLGPFAEQKTERDASSGYLQGILSGPINSYDFLLRYVSRIADFGIDLKENSFIVADNSFVMYAGLTFQTNEQGDVALAILSYPNENKPTVQTAARVISFIYAFVRLPSSDSVIETSGKRYYDSLSDYLDNILAATKDKPFIIKKYSFYAEVATNGDNMLFATLIPD